MMSSKGQQCSRWQATAFGAFGALMALAGVSQAAECRITLELPDALAVAPAPTLHVAPHVEPAASSGGRPTPALPHWGSHGQIVLGADAPRFFYHLPIFMADPWSHPHNFQVVLALSSADETNAAAADYAEDRSQHPDALYTAVPPVFDQIALVYDHMGGGRLAKFGDVELFRNHFERSDRHSITRDADLTIDRVIYFAELDPNAQPADTLAYLLFGQGDERFMAHLLSGPPDFDQILEVAAEDDALPEERVEQGLFVVFDGRLNRVEGRLLAGDEVTCTVEDVANGAAPDATLRIVADRYCEVGEVSHAVGQVVGHDFGPARPCPKG